MMEARFTGTISLDRVCGLITGESQQAIVGYARRLEQCFPSLRVTNTAMAQARDGSFSIIFEMR